MSIRSLRLSDDHLATQVLALQRTAYRVIERGVEQMIVSTCRDNAPARKLYLAAGFVALDDEEVVPGLFITHLAQQLIP